MFFIQPVVYGQFDPFVDAFNRRDDHKRPTVDENGIPYSEIDGCNFCADVLKTANEKSFKGLPSKPATSFRLTLRPTFSKPVIIMYHEDSVSDYIEIKRLSGKGGYDLGHVELYGKIKVAKNTISRITQTIKSKAFENLSKMSYEERVASVALDGAWWTLETLDIRGLKVIDLHGPEALRDNLSEDRVLVSKFAVSEFVKLGKDLFEIVGLSRSGYFE